MLTRNWRVVLLLVSLVFTFRDFGLGEFGAQWVVVGALAILLIGELTCDGCAAPSKKKKKK
jgi:hypothetical protein